MQLPFLKYHGAGNDFVLVHNPDIAGELSQQQIARICNRRFGVGADGLIIVEAHPEYDFFMRYYNSDGRESTMCGNGGRCAVAFARDAGYIGTSTTFLAADGPHKATLYGQHIVNLQMQDVQEIWNMQDGFFIDTGSPHYVQFVTDPARIDVYRQGRRLRYDPAFGSAGTNVNFIATDGADIHIRTYERGVENETLACGTGAVASAIAAHLYESPQTKKFRIHAKGGTLDVSFEQHERGYFSEVYLKGPARYVFSGVLQDISGSTDN